jgi:diguanylate cyclase (GGDEF)-like protein
MKIYTLKKGTIEKFLKRMRSKGGGVSAPKLDEVLKEILHKANEFVPSEAGSIILDDPEKKSQNIDNPGKNLLHFVACFGPLSEEVLGKSIRVTEGVAGKAYLSGKSFVKERTPKGEVDTRLKDRARSAICVPIVLGRSVCGVIELVNRKAHASYSSDDLKLLEIFAGYTSTLIQNALDANRNEELTRRDDLTGLFNDRYFHHQLSEELKKAKRTGKNISLLFLDLDNFKSINDTYGHLIGSRTLAEVGGLLTDCLAGENANIVRYGGDEFAVILPGKTRLEAVRVGEKIRKRIEEATYLTKKTNRTDRAYNIKGIVTCSVGIASFFEDGLGGKNLEDEKISFIRHADRAMYLAKERGKNIVCLAEKYEPGSSPHFFDPPGLKFPQKKSAKANSAQPV